MTGVVRRGSMVVDLMKTFVNFAISFKKECSDSFVATRTVEIVKDMMGSGFLKGMRPQSYYRYSRVPKIILRQASVFALVESLNRDNAGSTSLGISHLGEIGLYTETAEELTILNSTTRNFLASLSRAAPLYAAAFYSSAKTILRELRSAFIDHRTVPALEFVKFWNKLMCHMCISSSILLQMLFIRMRLHGYSQSKSKGA